MTSNDQFTPPNVRTKTHWQFKLRHLLFAATLMAIAFGVGRLLTLKESWSLVAVVTFSSPLFVLVAVMGLVLQPVFRLIQDFRVARLCAGDGRVGVSACEERSGVSDCELPDHGPDRAEDKADCRVS